MNPPPTMPTPIAANVASPVRSEDVRGASTSRSTPVVRVAARRELDRGSDFPLER